MNDTLCITYNQSWIFLLGGGFLASCVRSRDAAPQRLPASNAEAFTDSGLNSW